MKGLFEGGHCDGNTAALCDQKVLNERRGLVYWPFVKIPSRGTDLTRSLIGVLTLSLPSLVARPRRDEKYSITLRRTPASASASWTPQKSTSRLVLWL
jgi:hypothetical protein